MAAGVAQQRDQVAKCAGVGEEPQTLQPVCNAREQRTAGSVVMLECATEVPGEGLVIDAYSPSSPLGEHRGQHIECAVDSMSGIRKDGAQLFAANGEVQQPDYVGHLSALIIKRPTYMVVVPLKRLIERWEIQHSSRWRRDRYVLPHCLTAQIRGVQSIAPRPGNKRIDDLDDFLSVLHERSFSTCQKSPGGGITWSFAASNSVSVRSSPSYADGLCANLFKRPEMRSGLAQDDQDAVRRHRQRREPL